MERTTAFRLLKKGKDIPLVVINCFVVQLVSSDGQTLDVRGREMGYPFDGHDWGLAEFVLSITETTDRLVVCPVDRHLWLTFRTEILRTQDSRIPVEALAVILQLKINLFSHLTQWSLTSSLREWSQKLPPSRRRHLAKSTELTNGTELNSFKNTVIWNLYFFFLTIKLIII